MKLYEIVKDRLYQSGAVEGVDWQPIHERKIDIGHLARKGIDAAPADAESFRLEHRTEKCEAVFGQIRC